MQINANLHNKMMAKSLDCIHPCKYLAIKIHKTHILMHGFYAFSILC